MILFQIYALPVGGFCECWLGERRLAKTAVRIKSFPLILIETNITNRSKFVAIIKKTLAPTIRNSRNYSTLKSFKLVFCDKVLMLRSEKISYCAVVWIRKRVLFWTKVKWGFVFLRWTLQFDSRTSDLLAGSAQSDGVFKLEGFSRSVAKVFIRFLAPFRSGI